MSLRRKIECLAVSFELTKLLQFDQYTATFDSQAACGKRFSSRTLSPWEEKPTGLRPETLANS